MAGEIKRLYFVDGVNVTAGVESDWSEQVVSDFLDFNHNTTPDTPGTGVLRVYAKSDDSLYAKTPAGVEVPIGSGAGGSGEKNYIENPSAASAITGWVSSDPTNLVVSRSTTASELPRENTTGTGIKIVSAAAGAASGDHVYYDFNLDDIDVSRKLDVKWAQKILATYSAGEFEVFIAAQSNRAVAIATPLITDIPAADFDFKGMGFDTNTNTAVSLVIMATGAITVGDGIVISDVIVGPGQIFNAAGTGYLGSLAGFTVSANGSKTFTIANQCWRDNNELYCKFYLDGNATASGSGAGSTFTLNLPSGYTIDAASLPDTSNAANILNSLGDYIEYGITGASVYSDKKQIYAASSNTLRFLTGNGTATVVTIGQLNVARDMDIMGEFRVPIAEWAGAANYAGVNDVEWAATSGTWDAASSTTVYGPQGVAMGGTLTASRTKTVTFQTPIQASDDIQIQWSSDKVVWFPILGSRAGSGTEVVNVSYSAAGAFLSGVAWTKNSATAIDVLFAQYAQAANDDAPTYNWGTGYWRVRKARAGAAVGFGAATATRSGLLQPPTSIENVKATQMGLKSYAHGTTYNGGIAPTVTLTGGGGVLSSVDGTSFIPYQMQDGSWRLKGNIAVALDSQTRTTAQLTIDGISFSGTQAIAASLNTTGAYTSRMRANNASGAIDVLHASATTTTYYFSFDVLLVSKPTWAY